MSKLDKQRRLSVPRDILKESKFPPDVEQIGVCYDFKEKSLYLVPYCSLAPSDTLISIRIARDFLFLAIFLFYP